MALQGTAIGWVFIDFNWVGSLKNTCYFLSNLNWSVSFKCMTDLKYKTSGAEELTKIMVD